MSGVGKAASLPQLWGPGEKLAPGKPWQLWGAEKVAGLLSRGALASVGGRESSWPSLLLFIQGQRRSAEVIHRHPSTAWGHWRLEQNDVQEQQQPSRPALHAAASDPCCCATRDSSPDGPHSCHLQTSADLLLVTLFECSNPFALSCRRIVCSSFAPSQVCRRHTAAPSLVCRRHTTGPSLVCRRSAGGQRRSAEFECRF